MPGSFHGLFLNVSGILSKSFILIRVTICLYGQQGEGVGVGVVVVSPLLAWGSVCGKFRGTDRPTRCRADNAWLWLVQFFKWSAPIGQSSFYLSSLRPGTGTCHHSLTLICSATYSYSQSSPDGGLGKGTHHASPDAFCLVHGDQTCVRKTFSFNCNLSVLQQLWAPPPRLKPPLSPPSQLVSERCSVDTAPGLVTGGRVSSTQSVSVHSFCWLLLLLRSGDWGHDWPRVLKRLCLCCLMLMNLCSARMSNINLISIFNLDFSIFLLSG